MTHSIAPTRRTALIELDDHFDNAAALVSVPVPVASLALAPRVIEAPTPPPVAPRPAPKLERAYVLSSTPDMQRVAGSAASFRDMLAPADLDWDPVAVPLVTGEGVALPEEIGRAVVRSDTRAPVGVVGARYHTVSHRAAVPLADAIVEASGGTLRPANAGHRSNGARVFMQLATNPTPDALAQHYVSILTSHDGTSSLRVGFTSTVIVCRNTYAKAWKDCKSGLSIRHTASAEDTLKQAVRIAEEAARAGALFDARALAMMGERFDDDAMRRLASHVIPGESTRSENQRAELLRAWRRAPGAQPGTVWGAAQAVTYYTSHLYGSAESRAETATFGTGGGASVQEAAWWILDTDEETRTERLQSVKVLRA